MDLLYKYILSRIGIMYLPLLVVANFVDLSLAAEIPCKGEGVNSIEVPYYYNQHDSGKFSLKFGLVKVKEEAPTIIILNGGPGGPTMDTMSLGNQHWGIPNDVNTLYYDPRGVGCNTLAGPLVNEKLFTTEFLAHDLMAIITILELDNYHLMGASYGTQLATIFAYMAEQHSDFKLPRSIVLQSVTGGALYSHKNYIDSFNYEWKKELTLLPEAISEMFKQDPLPLGLSPSQWSNFIFKTTNNGFYPSQKMSVLHYYLSFLIEPKDVQGTLRQAILEMIRSDSVSGIQSMGSISKTSNFTMVFRGIACHEISEDWYSEMELREGILVQKGADYCEDIPLDAPFEAKRFPIKSIPIYYFQGTDDPATTLESAYSHFFAQNGAERYFVEIYRGKHVAMLDTLEELKCNGSIWEAIIKHDKAKFRAAVFSCPWPLKLKMTE